MNELLPLFTEICSMQNDLNIYLDPKWKSADYDFRLAASQEMSELIDHLPWKWWKASKAIDMAQVKLEVVDITHFIIADLLKYFNQPHLVAQLIIDAQDVHQQRKMDKFVKIALFDVVETDFNGVTPGKMLGTRKYDDLIANSFKLKNRLGNCSTIYLPDVLIELWELYDLQPEELAKIYFSKNTLNMFRYEHGYREGTYIKQWSNQAMDTTKTFHLYEDNVVLHNLVTGPLAGYDWTRLDTRKELYKLLEEKYQRTLLGAIA